MKTNIKVVLTGALLPLLGIGCAWNQSLPSVTVGAGANKDHVLNMAAGKKGVSVTAPLVNVNVPFPKLSVNESK